MFVAHYPNWVATVLYHDRVSHHFDGAKDLFIYLLDMKKWAQGRDVESIQSITVKEYYGLNRVDARKAYYVIGSDVLGPMGHELIPFVTLEDAKTFMRDHHGKKIYIFNDIDTSTLSILEKGVFE
jgi:copper chaperone NosL